jgi:alkylhydroperoxidase family enzyme
VAAVLADLDSAPIEEGLRATLRMLGKLTSEGTVGADDVRAVLSAGVSRRQIEDALAVGFAFNTTDRLANAFAFELLTREGFEAGAKYLLRRGYG